MFLQSLAKYVSTYEIAHGFTSAPPFDEYLGKFFRNILRAASENNYKLLRGILTANVRRFVERWQAGMGFMPPCRP